MIDTILGILILFGLILLIIILIIAQDIYTK